MAKRIKKSAVKPEMRQEWLRLYEKDGVSAPQIATDYLYDVRTVRRQLEVGRQEREIRETRSKIIRSALEQHFHDLVNYAELLRHEIKTGSNLPVLDGFLPGEVEIKYMDAAMRQHLPKSKIWSNLEKLDAIQIEIERLQKGLREEIRRELEANTGLAGISDYGEKQAVIDGITAGAAFQVRAWSINEAGLNIEDNLKSNKVGDNRVSLEYGKFNLGTLERRHQSSVTEAIGDIETALKHRQEFEELKQNYTKLERLKSSIVDDLTVIIYRRVVPGRCKYCPI
ncbi:MAG: hypothetical protein PHG45_00515 [Dehalococcoidales bacterium]|nr:hypothetical protein [Dehalococcoidales bacterium]